MCVTWHPVPAPGASHILWHRHVADYRNVYEQILAGVAAARAPLVALAEHDVLYPRAYHEALAEAARAGVCYNTNAWRLNQRGFFRTRNTRLLSNCGGPREELARRIRAKLAEARRAGIPEWAEPDSDVEFGAPHPTVDIRHGSNFTGGRNAPNGRYRQSIDYWGECSRYAGLLESGRDGRI